ncbi:RHS repeat protein [Trinickia diaoshuihuensis]|uniref:RHS repeat protein n=1 Tax=Trinickia diaoshuihuensis TaxID=2292265 RepID=UPI000E261FFD|nr:RHS repeat protein [Trinickia diaoshuihuensis]
MANSTSSFVTHATNFLSAISGAVDPRTGLYGVNIDLGKFVGNRALGPALPLSLRYSPLETMNFGFGKGFKLNTTFYRRGVVAQPRALLLSTGEQYAVAEGNGDVAVLQQRLKSFTFATQRNSNSDVTGYLVAHKSGSLEFLGASPTLCLPKKIYTGTGQWLELSWTVANDVPNLLAVTDGYGTPLLSATYSDVSAIVDILPGNATEGYRVVFTVQSEVLTDIVATGNDGELKWSFPSAPVGDGTQGRWITGMTAPGGYSEKATYPKNGGHAFAKNGPSSLLPFATQFERHPGGGQPVVTSQYKFSNTNFLGAFSGRNWIATEDCLLNGPFDSNYNYTSQETQFHTENNTPRNTIIQRAYNCYHLQTEETTTCGKITHTAATSYYLQPGQTLDQQPAYYQLPKSKAITWDNGQGKTHTETTQTTWDDWGNPLQKIDPDNVITTWSYYYERPSDQSDDNLPDDPNCPKDPSHFVRFPKWKRVDPTQVLSGLTDAPIHQIEYHFSNFSPAQNDLISRVVLKSYESHTSGGSVNNGSLVGATLLSEASYDYYGGGDAGRLKTHTFKHYPNGKSVNPYISTESFNYSSGNGPITTTHTLTSSDNQTITDNKTTSAFTGRMLSTTDLQNNVTTYTYDSFGRPKTRTLNSGSQKGFQNQWTYTNNVSSADQTGNHAGSWPFQIIQEDGKHNRICYTLDGHGQVLFIDINDRDSTDSDTYHTTEARQYDDMARPLVSTAFDYDLINGKTYSLAKTLTYDDWGNASSVAYSDNTVETTLHDFATQTVSVTKSGPNAKAGTEVTTYDYNFSKKEIKLERYLINKTPGVDAPYSTQTKEYDGLHLLRSETDQSDATGTTLNLKTQYQYDGWGRLIQTQLPDNTIVIKKYSDNSPDNHVDKITVSQKTIGTRVFDGLGRVTSKTVSGKQTQYSYKRPADTRPQYEITPDKNQLNYTYYSELSEALWTVSVGETLSQTYEYEPVSGVLNYAASTAENGSTLTNIGLYDSGRLKSETITYDDVAAPKPTFYTYTVAGSLISYQHIDNAISNISRNPQGRITSIADDNISVVPSYDGLGRMTGWTAAELVNGHPSHTLTTVIQYDDFDRETSRTVTDNRTNNAWTTTQQWYINDLLKSRAITKGKSRPTIYVYSYDNRNRLIAWDVSKLDSAGPARPMDRYGNEMLHQDFVIDSFGNITSATTTLVPTQTLRSPRKNVATFSYDQEHPCLLTSVTNTDPTYSKGGAVQYDDAGRITFDGMETHLTYDKLGRVSTANSTLTNLSGDYAYDHHNRLYREKRKDQSDPVYFYYKHEGKLDQLVNLIQGENRQRLFRSPSSAPAAQFNTGTDAGAWLLGADMLGSVVNGSDGQNTEERSYSAYGEESAVTAK